MASAIDVARRGKSDDKRVGIYLRAKDGAPREDTIAALLFSDTVAARMLRMVLLLGKVGTITQADFMREYARRCARPAFVETVMWYCESCNRQISVSLKHLGCGRCGVMVPIGQVVQRFGKAPSSYATNFDRYSVRTSTASHVTGPAEFWRTQGANAHGYHWCLWRYIPEEKKRVKDPKRLCGGRRERASIHWRAPAWPDLVAGLSDRMLHLAFEYVERQWHSPWVTDTAYDHEPWVSALRAEITVRKDRAPASVQRASEVPKKTPRRQNHKEIS